MSNQLLHYQNVGTSSHLYRNMRTEQTTDGESDEDD